MSDILKKCIDFTGDVDTVAAIALGAASCSKDIVQDLPDGLVLNLENGTYGRDFLVGLDKKLMTLVKFRSIWWEFQNMDLNKTVTLKDAIGLVVSRSEVALDSCNSHLSLVASTDTWYPLLFLGKDPGSPKDLQHVLDLIDLPYRLSMALIYWGDDLKRLLRKSHDSKAL